MLVTFNIRNNVPLQIPSECCCNCGAREAVQQVESKLRLMPLFGLIGAEISVPMPLPYCPTCASTARRTRPNVLSILALVCLLSIALITAWFFGAGELLDKVPIEYAAIVVVTVSVVLVGSFYLFRRAAPPQTSYYQPVRLVKLSQKWPADITAMILQFSNESYAKLFEIANSDAVKKGILKIVTN